MRGDVDVLRRGGELVTRCLFAAFVVALGIPAAFAASERPPNIVFFLVDDLGWSDVGVFGSTFHETPNIDRLAEQGVRFTNAYAHTSARPRAPRS